MNRVDEKGKLFTEHIRKYAVEAEIVTVNGTIHGNLHPAPGQRLKDMLNLKEELFLAVTDATIMKHDGSHTQQAPFMAVNKQHVISIVPFKEDKPPAHEEDYYSG